MRVCALPWWLVESLRALEKVLLERENNEKLYLRVKNVEKRGNWRGRLGRLEKFIHSNIYSTDTIMHYPVKMK